MEFTSDVRAVRPVEPPRRALFLGNGWTLFGIYVRNILLTIVTLGIYYFWGKNRTRRYLVSHCEFEGDRFAWHGTGRELLLGMLKFLLVAGPILALLIYLQIRWQGSAAGAVATLAIYVGYLLLVPLLAVGARRYRYSRLSWHGIRFSFRGRFWEFFKLYLRGIALTALTLGLYYPYFQTEIRRFVTDRSYFGATRFAFDGRGGDLFKPYLVMVVLSALVIVIAGFLVVRSLMAGGTFPVPDASTNVTVILRAAVPIVLAALAIGAAWVWFWAFRHRYFWAHTSFASTRFRSTVTAARLIGLEIINLLLLIITLGLAFPWVMVRSFHFFFHHVMVTGPLDLAAVVQDAQAAGATVESAADVFDLDLFGIDLPL